MTFALFFHVVHPLSSCGSYFWMTSFFGICHQASLCLVTTSLGAIKNSIFKAPLSTSWTLHQYEASTPSQPQHFWLNTGLHPLHLISWLLWSKIFSLLLLTEMSVMLAGVLWVCFFLMFSFSQYASNCKCSINYFWCCFICFHTDQPVYWWCFNNLAKIAFF